MMPNLPRAAAIFALAFSLASCAAVDSRQKNAENQPASLAVAAPQSPPKTQKTVDLGNGWRLQSAAFDQLPGWREEDHSAALSGFIYSCQKLARQKFTAAKLDQIMAAELPQMDWGSACRIAQNSDAADARLFFEHFFTPYQILNNDKTDGLITGYYEADLRASRRKHGAYKYPVYRMPPDHLLQLTREQINRGALAGKKLELLWADDPVAVFAMHIQGSARVQLDDGTVTRIGFAGKNKHPYFSIGKTFLAEKLIPSDKINMPSIEQWLRANPKSAAAVMSTNPSYIFFREIPDLQHADGPIGAYGIPLLPERSIAVDRALYPLGWPMWIDVPHPDSSRPDLQHMVFAHDTGSAITGPIRADYFFGAGDAAKINAGLMRGRGKLYVFLPNSEFLVSQK